MGLLDIFKKNVAKQLDNRIFSFILGFEPPRMGEKDYLESYKGWVYACVNSIAEEVGMMDFKLQRRLKDGQWQEVPNHPAMQLLNNVNPFMSSFDLLFGTQAFLELHGNAFWYLATYKNTNTIAEIWLLDPTRVGVVKDQEKFIGGYVFINDKGQKVPFKPEEIIHFKKFNPNNPYRGIGTVEAAALAIDTDTFSAKYQRNFFGNSALPSAVLQSDKELTQDQYNRIKANWDSKYKGVDNAHKMAILEGGLKFQSMTLSQKDMQYLEGRKATRDEILGIFRVSKTILGLSDDVNRANAEAAEYTHGKHIIKPKMEFLCDKLTEFYLPKFNLNQKGKEYRIFYSDPVPENQELLIDQLQKGLQGASYLTINEARAQMDLPPLDGDGGNEIFIANNVVPIGKALQTDDYVEPKSKKPAHTKEIKKKFRIITQKQADRKTRRKEYIDTQIAQMAALWKGLFKKLEQQMLQNLSKAKGFKKDAIDDEEATDDMVRILFENYDDWVGIVQNSTPQGLKDIYETSGKEAIASVDAEGSFDLENPRAVDWLNNHAAEMVTSVVGTTKDKISTLVTNAMDEGLSVTRLPDLIQTIVPDFADWESERIARTETINAFSQGTLEGYKQSDVVDKKYWIPDEAACPICEGNAEDGEIGLDEEFSSGVDAPVAHPNCECDLGATTRSDESLLSEEL